MITLEKCNRLINEGFSLLTVSDDKIPNFSWKENQTRALTKEEFKKRYDYSGGIFLKSGDEMLPTKNVGLITGFDYLECIDIDLKVLSTAKEQVDFWNELLSFLQDHIYDFDKKFVIYKTQNAGYHIIYKSKRVEGNKKIAKLKGHKECIIESRGTGGYIFLYEDNISEKTYKDIDFISDEDREILWSICKTYDYIEEEKEKPVKIPDQKINTSLTPWDDYNKKTSIFDIIGSDFDTVRNLTDKYIIKRKGAKSAHSGYVYKNSGCMYLFSTGTIYPHEELISSFKAFAIKYHNSNFSEAAKDLYKKGYGDRVRPEKKETIEDDKIEIAKEDFIFPIDIFPKTIQNYIIQCNKTLNSSIDYMGCSLLWLLSVIIGNSIKIEVKKGWIEAANLWIAIVGGAGVGKTPSIGNMTFPLQKLNMREIKRYVIEFEKYIAYQNLEKKEKALTEEVFKPKKTQFIVNDITLEALIELHSENRNSIGVLKDELAGWFKEMNRYRTGSDLEHWLSSWSGKEINLNRKVAKSSFVDKAFIPVFGGIQPGILDEFYTEENKDNGFMDRLLFSFPDLEVEYYNEDDMSEETIQNYDDYIVSFYEQIKNNIQFYDNIEIKPHIAKLTKEAKKEWIRIFNRITKDQNNDNENEYMKSMLPKQKSYIPRFALLINSLNEFDTYLPNYNKISKESILKAEKLSNYFIAMAKKIKLNSYETKDIKKALFKNEDKTNYQKVLSVYKNNKDFNRSKLGELLGVSRRTIQRYVTEIENNQ